MRIRSVAAAALSGSILVGTAWAGIGLAPVSSSSVEDAGTAVSRLLDASAGEVTVNVTTPGGEPVVLGEHEVLAGAAKVDLYPTPDASKGEIWEKNKAKCLPAGTSTFDPQAALTHAADFRTPHIENTNCLYMGGFGIGPSQPITDFDPVYGLWARSAAYSRGGQTLVVTIVDSEGYNAIYNKLCPPEKKCGALDIAQQMGDELKLDPASFVIATTHAHSAMDFIGGWGAVPTWYMRQAAEAIRQSIRDAVNGMQPATLEGGDTLARGSNSERRDSYYSAEDQTLNWLRAIGRDGSVISTVGTYSAHATSFGSSASIAHADWPGVFAKEAETKFGGTGMVFQAGLGNMSARANDKGSMGIALAKLLPPLGSGTLVTTPDVKVKQAFWDQPVTNLPLGSLGAVGFFDRPFAPTASVVEAVKPGWNIPCRSASPLSVHTQVTAARIGGVIVTAAPGEVFANYTNTIEERSSITALAIGQANDALGYMPQSFETDHKGRQGGGFVGGGVAEYEDAYGLDACFGDKALMTTLTLLGELG